MHIDVIEPCGIYYLVNCAYNMAFSALRVCSLRLYWSLNQVVAFFTSIA